jgi:ATP-dependent helicase HrpB
LDLVEQRSKKETLMPELLEFILDEAPQDEARIFKLDHESWLKIFYQILDYSTVQAWQQDCPISLELPNKRKIKIHYSEQFAEIEVLLRDLFGLKKHPTVLGQPLRVVILGPNRRPIQITQNLEVFWKISYFEIRKELRGRYPKQPWPDDPTQLLLKP